MMEINADVHDKRQPKCGVQTAIFYTFGKENLMIGFVNGEKLLTESDLPPQWNLLKGTSDWSGDWTNKGSWKATTKHDSNGNLLLNRVGSWYGIQQFISAFANQIYTFSVFITNLQNSETLGVYASDNSKPLKAYLDGKEINLPPNGQFDTSKINDNQEHKAIFTFQPIQDGTFSVRIENPYETGSLNLSSMKLERGSKATAWMPAISDLMLKNQ